MAMGSKKVGSAVEWALVDYDAHDRRLYPTIYKHLGVVSVKLTESVVLINLAQVNRVHQAFSEINKEAGKRGTAITFNITDAHPRKAGELRQRAIKALNEQTRNIGKRLLKKIAFLEGKFNEKTDDVNAHVYKRRLVLAAAGREINAARAVAMLFLIDKDVSNAVEASQKVLDAQKKLWGEMRKKNLSPKQKARAEKKAEKEKEKAEKKAAREKARADKKAAGKKGKSKKPAKAAASA